MTLAAAARGMHNQRFLTNRAKCALTCNMLKPTGKYQVFFIKSGNNRLKKDHHRG